MGKTWVKPQERRHDPISPVMSAKEDVAMLTAEDAAPPKASIRDVPTKGLVPIGSFARIKPLEGEKDGGTGG